MNLDTTARATDGERKRADDRLEQMRSHQPRQLAPHGLDEISVLRKRNVLRLSWLGVRDGIRNYLITAA